MAQSSIASDAGSTAAGVQGYQVVARRYRPQRFDELVGQEHVARGLSGAIESGRIGHAYLFTGARGVGKTSAARIYAKAIECSNRVAGEPCNACQKCLAILSGQDVDVVEIDAASNRGIDEMRQLRQNCAVRPAHGRFKIYIIDEVHMLTREAFNALLKTLEEPPSHVKFVLCTTEPDKLPITILSRCQRFDFQTVDAPAIARRLAQIVEAEGADVTAEALTLIARRAAGSMRDSQSLLEQLLGAASGPINADDVHAIIGTGREEKVGELVACLIARDPRSAIAAFDAAIAGGADPGGVLEQVMAALRDSLLASVGCGPELLLQGAGLGVDLAAAGRQTGTITLLAMLQIIDHALGRMRLSGHATVLAEMAVIRLASLEDLDHLAEVVERVGTSTSLLTASGPSGSRPALPPVRPAAEPASARPAAPPAAEPAREKKTTDLIPLPATEALVPEPVPEAELATPLTPPSDPLDAWRRAGAAVGGLVADFADMSMRAEWRDELLEVVLPRSAGQAASFLRRPEIAVKLTQALTDMLGRPVRHSLVIDTAATAASAGEPNGRSNGSAQRGQPAVSQAALLREASEHPLVLHARTVFDAAVRKVDPPRPQSAAPAAVPPQTATADADDDQRGHARVDSADGSVGSDGYGGADG